MSAIRASSFSHAADGEPVIEDQWEPDQGQYDIVLAIGTLDTVNDLQRALFAIRLGLKTDGFLIWRDRRKTPCRVCVARCAPRTR